MHFTFLQLYFVSLGIGLTCFVWGAIIDEDSLLFFGLSIIVFDMLFGFFLVLGCTLITTYSETSLITDIKIEKTPEKLIIYYKDPEANEIGKITEDNLSIYNHSDKIHSLTKIKNYNAYGFQSESDILFVDKEKIEQEIGQEKWTKQP